MFQVENVEQWTGQAVIDADGERLGKLAEVYFDVRVGMPTLGVVKIHRRKHLVLVPLPGAVFARAHVRLPYPGDLVRSAPRLDPGGLIHREDEVVIGRHYQVATPADDGTDGSGYQSSKVLEANRQAAAGAAGQGGGPARSRGRRPSWPPVVETQATAAEAEQQAAADEAERRRLLAEAEALRRGGRPRCRPGLGLARVEGGGPGRYRRTG